MGMMKFCHAHSFCNKEVIILDLLGDLQAEHGIKITLHRGINRIQRRQMWEYVIHYTTDKSSQFNEVPHVYGWISDDDINQLVEKLPAFIKKEEHIHITRIDEWGDTDRMGKGIRQTTSTPIFTGRIIEPMSTDGNQEYSVSIFGIRIINADEKLLQKWLEDLKFIRDTGEISNNMVGEYGERMEDVLGYPVNL